jgi:uncharacterized protein (DUF1778 family)
MRVNATQRNLLECAAALKNLTVADFMALSALKAARHAIKEHQHIMLSPRDSEAFVQALTDPLPVNSRLRDTVRRYRKGTGI